MNAHADDLPPKEDITQLLIAYGQGDRRALDRLLPVVYSELHGIAARQMRHERADQQLRNVFFGGQVVCCAKPWT